jgi:two-component system catabolic regulation response regulator CreB
LETSGERSAKRILVVEDEQAIAESIAYALKTEGFDALHVVLGSDAIEKVRRDAPELVILDVGLPDLSGFEVCRQLRQFSDVPVIFLTARSDEIDRIVGLEIGADDYVTKPFSPRELVARVRVVLRRLGGRATPAPADAPRFDYLLLKALVEHPGHVLSRAQLMDRVWSDAPDTLDRTVDAHVKALRAKLRQVDPADDPIRTHRGMGYSLAAA